MREWHAARTRIRKRARDDGALPCRESVCVCAVCVLRRAAEYPLLMGLLRQRTHKELATRIVHTVLDTNTRITSVDKAAMLFRRVRRHNGACWAPQTLAYGGVEEEEATRPAWRAWRVCARAQVHPAPGARRARGGRHGRQHGGGRALH